MIVLTMPDGSVRKFEQPVTGMALAQSISPSLARRAVAVFVDQVLIDLSRPIEHNASVRVVTSDDCAGVEVIRHDAAHVLAQAVKSLFPQAQITIGPVIEGGFYYDVLTPRPLEEKDLVALEAEMRAISKRETEIVREVWAREDAIEFFTSQNEHFKAEIVSQLPRDEIVTLYRQGDFVDLCRGPHAPHTGFVKYFKLMKLAGAYWRGDSRNQMLQRIYGTAWSSQKDLDAYLHQLEEASKRDHRKLGTQLDLFHLQEEAPGMIFWHHQGWTLFRAIENFVRSEIQKAGYLEVRTPVLVDTSLWAKSGHLEKFSENMFFVEDDKREFALKPMNCPCHIEIFKKKLTSYKDLPLRMAEFGSCFRNESSGSLHGLMRVRAMTQDDAHIFCTEEQIESETVAFCALLGRVYKRFGFDSFEVKFSDRPEKRAGSDSTWDKAEQALMSAAQAAGISVTLNKGEGAFYGPKLEFCLTDAIGRQWQCGTIQVDFVLPHRLDACYIDKSGSKAVPVMLHRAILGSLERFTGILIEHHAGALPFWLSPTQIAIVTITTDALDYAQQTMSTLELHGYRCVLDSKNETLNYKLRHFLLLKVPYIIIVGRKESQNGSFSVRTLGSEEQVHCGSMGELLQSLKTASEV